MKTPRVAFEGVATAQLAQGPALLREPSDNLPEELLRFVLTFPAFGQAQQSHHAPELAARGAHGVAPKLVSGLIPMLLPVCLRSKRQTEEFPFSPVGLLQEMVESRPVLQAHVKVGCGQGGGLLHAHGGRQRTHPLQRLARAPMSGEPA